MNDGEARRRVEQARVARLGTLQADERVHLVPICFVLAGDTLYTAVDRKPKRSQALKRLENVRANAHACVLIDEWHEDWSQLWWVRLRGPARVLEQGAERERAVELLKAKYAQYAGDPLEGPVIAVDIDEWRGWRAS